MDVMDKQDQIDALRLWRASVAERFNLDTVQVLRDEVIEEIVRRQPKTLTDLGKISGVTPKRLSYFGEGILAILRGEAVTADEVDIRGTPNELSVSAFLDRVSAVLKGVVSRSVAIRGEISEVQVRAQGAFITLKDVDDESILGCYMSPWAYRQLGFDMEAGMEVKVYGEAQVYKPYGKLSFSVQYAELAGEGALRKAYELMKKRLEEEGLFERKRPLPSMIQRIGVVTSKSGAVIDDFRRNLDPLGLDVRLYHVNVEGAYAADDIIRAITYFNMRASDIDVLVIIRGGGSLESMQAFNTEGVARAIFASKIPTICGIGHDKDVPIASLVGDVMTSTPSIAATMVNKSWDALRNALVQYEHTIFSAYDRSLRGVRAMLGERTESIFGYLRSIFVQFRTIERRFVEYVDRSIKTCAATYSRIHDIRRALVVAEDRSIADLGRTVQRYEAYIEGVNPERNLRLGYSIIRNNKGDVVRSVDHLSEGDPITAQLADGEVVSTVNKKRKK
jgi:exodeoxyribonuclease VII large subunit